MPVNIEQYLIFGIQLVNYNNLGLLALKLIMDLLFTLIIIRFIFYPIYKERDYVFSTIMINVSVFLICFLMASVKFKIGFAFGLFAVFAILRYRTEQIAIREMTYLFVVIIVAVLNSLSDETISYAELILANMVILLSIYILENNLLHVKEVSRLIVYEKIDLIKPENHDLLIKDLKERTGYNVTKAELVTISFLNDTAKIKISYDPFMKNKDK
jgi:hypothetical protein